MGFTVKLPPVMLYVPLVAPDGIIVNEFPLQIVPLVAEMVGVIRTVTLEVAATEDTHPTLLVPITV